MESGSALPNLNFQDLILVILRSLLHVLGHK